jgi:hypothetical protein
MFRMTVKDIFTYVDLDVAVNDGICILDFYTSFKTPESKDIGLYFEQFAKKYESDNVHFYKFTGSIDECLSPTIVIFEKGKIIDRVSSIDISPMDIQKIKNMIEKIIVLTLFIKRT